MDIRLKQQYPYFQVIIVNLENPNESEDKLLEFVMEF